MDALLVQDRVINPSHPSRPGEWLQLGERTEAGSQSGNWHYFEQNRSDPTSWVAHHKCNLDEVARIMTALSDGKTFERQVVSFTCTLLFFEIDG